jgi:hypothetical protein
MNSSSCVGDGAALGNRRPLLLRYFFCNIGGVTPRFHGVWSILVLEVLNVYATNVC